MKEFKVGDKVLVEAEITNIFDGWYNLKTTYRGASICMMEMQANKVYPLSAGKTYEDGMAEAWEVARRIAWDPDRVRVFGTFDLEHIFKDHTWQEAAAKIKAYEDAQEICVGDVVKITTGAFEGVVTKVKEEGYYVIFGDGSSGKFKKSAIKKIGRTIDIAGLLAEIGGRNDSV